MIEAENAVVTSTWLRERIIEVHPELCFRMMAGAPLQNNKKQKAGKAERRRLLQESGFEDLPSFEAAARRLDAAPDDALDACPASWSAWRRSEGTARYLPADSAESDFTLRIWY